MGKSRGDCFTVFFQNTVRIIKTPQKGGALVEAFGVRNLWVAQHGLAARKSNALNERQLFMEKETKDGSLLEHIQHLASEEHRLFAHPQLSDVDRARLAKINVELDQCWDLLRQRQALRDAGRNPDDAHVRPPEIVENYEQ